MPKMEEEFMEEKKEFGLEFVNIRLNHDRTLFTDKRIDNPDAAVHDRERSPTFPLREA